MSERREKQKAESAALLADESAIREARREAWLQERVFRIYTAIDMRDGTAVKLLREACEAWPNIK